jgi:apolipoprotein N-acyltransferase
LKEIETSGRPIDWLVNLTNDGWFFGTSCLDLHLACNVFRAVELRRPMLVAANTGFSAEIDRHGRLLQQGPRREEGILRVRLDQQPTTISPYRMIGDWPWFACGIFVFAGLLSIPFVSRTAN